MRDAEIEFAPDHPRAPASELPGLVKSLVVTLVLLSVMFLAALVSERRERTADARTPTTQRPPSAPAFWPAR